MPPEMCAMPEVMTVISSDSVMRGRYGRIVSGASVWPMKMLAATFSDSAPLARITRCITTAKSADDELHDAEVIEDGEERGDEDDRRQHLEGEDDAVAAPPPGPSTVVMIRGQASLSPSGPKTKLEPTKAKSSSWLISVAERWKSAWPAVGLQDEQREDDLQRRGPRRPSGESIARRLVDSA